MKYKVEIELTEEMLGSLPNDTEIYETYIASKSPTPDNPETLGEIVNDEKGMTIFPKADGKPFIYDYQFKGFFKDACGALSRCEGTKSSKIKAYKKIIDGCIFIFPRQIFLNLPENTTIGTCQRPLRAQTAQGERIALAKSETVPAGTYFDVEIRLLDEKYEDLVLEWLEYGALRGIGQWRNSGKGRFTFAKA